LTPRLLGEGCACARVHVAGWSSSVARRAHNPKVAGSNPAPATKNRRSPRLFAYAQAADQHVWVGGLSFMGRVCGVLLNSCVGQKGGAPGHGRGDTLRVRASRCAASERCTGQALRSAMQLPYSTTPGATGPNFRRPAQTARGRPGSRRRRDHSQWWSGRLRRRLPAESARLSPRPWWRRAPVPR